MVNNRVLLGFIAFAVSFVITLLISQDLGRSLLTGITAVPAAYLAISVVNLRMRQQTEQRVETLKHNIQALLQRRHEAYQEFTEMLDEKEQVAAALNSMQLQLRQLQLEESELATVRGGSSSWSLAAGSSATAGSATAIALQPHNLPTEIQDPRSGKVQPANGDTDRRKTEVSLEFLNSELTHIKGQVTDYRQKRDRLAQELTSLTQQKQQQEGSINALRSEVQQLEQSRSELERFIAYAEAKKQELDSGNHPLQIALKQLQAETNRLHEEMHSLEGQVTERRGQRQKAEPPETVIKSTTKQTEKSPTARPASKSTKATPTTSDPAIAAPKVTQLSSQPIAQITLPSPNLPSLPRVDAGTEPRIAPEFADEWNDLLMQLPDHEFRVLKAIAEQANPTPTIRRIAEENATKPDLLIDAINERALDTIGDLIIESGADAPTIAAEHVKPVQHLIQTYEYLMQ
jgi:predicted nuclease with TOPRIM domain